MCIYVQYILANNIENRNQNCFDDRVVELLLFFSFVYVLYQVVIYRNPNFSNDLHDLVHLTVPTSQAWWWRYGRSFIQKPFDQITLSYVQFFKLQPVCVAVFVGGYYIWRDEFNQECLIFWEMFVFKQTLHWTSKVANCFSTFLIPLSNYRIVYSLLFPLPTSIKTVSSVCRWCKVQITIFREKKHCIFSNMYVSLNDNSNKSYF